MLTPLEGEELNISCIIRGIPLPNITWYKDGVLFPIPPPPPPTAPLPRVLVIFEQINATVVEWQLTFASVNRSDAGNYTCSATQSRGGEVTVVNSSAVYLNVFCKLPVHVSSCMQIDNFTVGFLSMHPIKYTHVNIYLIVIDGGISCL